MSQPYAHCADIERLDQRPGSKSAPAARGGFPESSRRGAVAASGVLLSITGLGCLSTPLGDAELESLVETFAAVLAAERGTR
jgi:hypothetical protein